MTTHIFTAIPLLALAIFPPSVLAQSQPPAAPAVNAAHSGVKVGDPAPGIGSPTWGYGEGVKSLEPGRFYAIVFAKGPSGVSTAWAPPETDTDTVCAAAAMMPPRDAGSVILVRGCSPNGTNTRFKPGAFGFAVACGLPEDVRMKWLGERPRWYATAFVIDDRQRIAWIGGVGDMPFVLEEVRANRFDAAKFDTRHKEYTTRIDEAERSVRDGDHAVTRAAIDAAIRALPHRQAHAETWWCHLIPYINISATVKKLPLLSPEDRRAAQQRVFDVATLADAGVVQSICISLESRSRDKSGETLFGPRKDADDDNTDLRLALAGQKRLIELSGMNDWISLDAAARLHGKLGEWDEAVKMAALALSAAPDDKRPVLSERVEAYGEKRMPSR